MGARLHILMLTGCLHGAHNLANTGTHARVGLCPHEPLKRFRLSEGWRMNLRVILRYYPALNSPHAPLLPLSSSLLGQSWGRIGRRIGPDSLEIKSTLGGNVLWTGRGCPPPPRPPPSLSQRDHHQSSQMGGQGTTQDRPAGKEN